MERGVDHAKQVLVPGAGRPQSDVEHFRGLKSQVDSLFEDWFGRSMGGVLAPRVDVAEDDKAVTLTAELPGVKESDIEVLLAGDQLTIKGEKRSEHEEKKESEGRVIHRTERSYGAFQRTLTVPYQVEPDQVSAEFKDGVLTITLSKRPMRSRRSKDARSRSTSLVVAREKVRCRLRWVVCSGGRTRTQPSATRDVVEPFALARTARRSRPVFSAKAAQLGDVQGTHWVRART